MASLPMFHDPVNDRGCTISNETWLYDLECDVGIGRFRSWSVMMFSNPAGGWPLGNASGTGGSKCSRASARDPEISGEILTKSRRMAL